MTGAIWEYAAVFAASLLLAFVLTPYLLRFAERRGVLDHPGDHKSHSVPVPYLGGVALVSGFSAAVAAAAIIRPPESGLDELVTVLAIGVVLAVVGLADDLRGLGAWVRLIAQIVAGIGLWIAGARVEFTGHETTDLLITVVWVVGITNAFNLLDNMDGLSAGVATIAAGSLFVLAAVNDQYLVAGLAAALGGCALGFLRHNFHPARIYMGDAGSLYLGFLLAYLGLKLRFNAPDEVTFLVPILALGVPILDTTLVTVSRVLHRRSPFLGGRDHVSHRLLRLGLSVRAAVGTIYVAAALFGGVAYVVSRLDRTPAYVVAGITGVVGLMVIAALGRVPVYDDEIAGAQPSLSRG